MRLDARDIGFPATQWHVYDAEACAMRKNVVWVDDQTNEYGEYGSSGLEVITRHARRIAIHVDRRLVIINPIDDTEDARVTRAVSEPIAQAA